jgi:hypothetical protein
MEQQVKGPAIGLIVTGVLGLLAGILSIGANALGLAAGRVEDYGDNAMFQFMMSGAFGILVAVISLGVSGFLLWAGLLMQKLEKFAVCRIASIVAMIPCFACCLVGLPVGIWALVVMSKPEVRAAFKS